MLNWTPFSFTAVAIIALAAVALIGYLAYRYWEVAASLVFVAVLLVGFIFLPGALADPVVEGNIDLDSRIVVFNKDDTFSTEISFSVEIDGLEVLLPLIINGELVSEEEAIDHFLRTGEHLGMFSSVEECEQYAEELHLQQEEKYRITAITEQT